MGFDIGSFYQDKFKLLLFVTSGLCAGIFLIIAIAGGATHLSFGGSGNISPAVICACIFSIIFVIVAVLFQFLPQYVQQLYVLITAAAYAVILLIITFACWGMNGALIKNTDKVWHTEDPEKLAKILKYRCKSLQDCSWIKIKNYYNSYRLAISILGFIFGLWTAAFAGYGLYVHFSGGGGGGAGGFTAVNDQPASF